MFEPKLSLTQFSSLKQDDYNNSFKKIMITVAVALSALCQVNTNNILKTIF